MQWLLEIEQIDVKLLTPLDADHRSIQDADQADFPLDFQAISFTLSPFVHSQLSFTNTNSAADKTDRRRTERQLGQTGQSILLALHDVMAVALILNIFFVSLPHLNVVSNF